MPASRTLWQWLLVPELYFWLRTFIILVQTKKVLSMNYGSSTSSWKPCRSKRLNLIIPMRNININSNLNSLIKFTSSRGTTEFKDILPRGISQMIMKSVPINTRIVTGNAMKIGILLWIWWKFKGNWDNNMTRISQKRESHCRTNTSVRRKKSKRAGLWESQFGIQVGKLTNWVRLFEIDKL